MGQSFQLVAPRAKLTLPWTGKLGEILFDGSARDLVSLLAVPVPQLVPHQVSQQHNSPQTPSIDSTDTICKEKRGVKRSRDDDNVHVGSPPYHKQTKVQTRHEKTVSNNRIALSNLPLKLHQLIFSFLEHIEDIISLSITNRSFLSTGREGLEYYYTLHLGRWAGTNVIYVGHDVEPNDC